MRNLKRTSSLLAFVLLLVTLATAQPMAAGDCPNKGDQKGKHGNMNQGDKQGCDKMAAYLELNDEQKTKIEAMRLDQQKKMLPLKNELGEKEARMKTLSTAEVADMKAINSLIDEMAVIKTKMSKEGAAHHQEIRKILTAEQRIKFDMNNGERGHQKHCGRN